MVYRRMPILSAVVVFYRFERGYIVCYYFCYDPDIIERVIYSTRHHFIEENKYIVYSKAE